MLDHLPYMMVGAATVLTSSPLLFLLAWFLNVLVNRLLKNSIKQPRPKDCDTYLKKSYGMPSCHSQNASFSSAFVWFEITDLQKMIFVLLTLVTMAQRVVSHCHSVSQVLVGSVVGAIFGLICFQLLLMLQKSVKKQSMF